MTGVELLLPVSDETGNATDSYADFDAAPAAVDGCSCVQQRSPPASEPVSTSAVDTSIAANTTVTLRADSTDQRTDTDHHHQQQLWQSLFRTASATSSYGGGGGGTSGVGGRCWQSQLAEQCRVVRQRRRYDQIVKWCVREGISDVGCWQQLLDSLPRSRRRQQQQQQQPQRASMTSLTDIESTASVFASVTDLSMTGSTRYDRLMSDVLDGVLGCSSRSYNSTGNSNPGDYISDDGGDDVISDNTDSDDPEDGPLERIPRRFRLASDTSTVVGELFWSSRRTSGAVSAPATSRWTSASPSLLQRPKISASKPPEMPLPPPRRMASLSNAERRSLMMNRQYAMSHDIVAVPLTTLDVEKSSIPVLQRASTVPASQSAEYDDQRKNNRVVGISDVVGVGGGSLSSSAGSSGSDRSVVGTTAGPEDGDEFVVALRDQLLVVVELLKADIPMHFWPSLGGAPFLWSESRSEGSCSGGADSSGSGS